MAQTAVSDYFSKRKRCDGLQPSKRRKVLATENADAQTVGQLPTKTPPVGARTRSRITPAPAPKPTVTAPKKASRAKAKPQISVQPTNQKTISDILSNLGDNPTKEQRVEAVPTAARDNHNASPPCSPVKHRQTDQDDSSGGVSRKRSRAQKTVCKDLFQAISPSFEFAPKEGESSKNKVKEELNFNFQQPLQKSPEGRKIVNPRRSLEAEPKSPVFTFTGDKGSVQDSEKMKELAIAAFTPKASTSKGSEESSPVLSADKMQDLVAKIESKPGAMKSKLKGCGKLAELKSKLLELNKPSSPKKKTQTDPKIMSPRKMTLLEIAKSPVKAARATPSKPAYERFASLAEPVPPGLTLPAHYRLLHEVFTSCDQVVSMLHKRAEMCTFSKLKSAVQKMTHKNFEERNMGQIKTIYPTAYCFKQEKNIPCYGQKVSGYQLTVEANLTQDPLSVVSTPLPLTKDGRPDFTATKILQRKNVFHRKLIDIIKKYHKEFITNLDRPMNIPDNKVTRWHPAFSLDKVPDVEPSELPQAPNIQVITTAKAALDHARDKYNSPRIMEALENVANRSKSEESNNKSPSSSTSSSKKGETPTKGKNNSPKKQPEEIKGVSMSLLDRIRAKEAKKQEEALMRTPAEERKKERMARLPDLVRILRTSFVTQKKPALLIDDVLQKFTDSYKSCLGQVEAEVHLKLMSELVPEWLSILKIKSGTFVKIDRNKDVNVVVEKLEKLHKQAA